MIQQQNSNNKKVTYLDFFYALKSDLGYSYHYTQKTVYWC